MDELLESIDLSTYSLARTKLAEGIGLDASGGEAAPQNPYLRGAHGGDADRDPLDEIVRAFKERWFQGWDATPEEQKIKFINIARHIINDANYRTRGIDNPDWQNSLIALEQLNR